MRHLYQKDERGAFGFEFRLLANRGCGKTVEKSYSKPKVSTVCKSMIRALRATESDGYSHTPHNFGPRLHFNAASITKIKISPGKPYNYLTCVAIPQKHGYLSDSSEREVVA
jgi:hypothetical protein